MKLVRCVIQLADVDRVVVALKAACVVGVTMTEGSGWYPNDETCRLVHRGCDYAVERYPKTIIDVTVSDDTVDEIVRRVMDACSVGPVGYEGRILVLPVEESYTIRSRHHYVA